MSSSRDTEQERAQSFTLTPRAIIGILIAILALVFVLQNTRTGRVEFLFWDANAPGWLWMISLLAAGFIIGSIFPWFRRRDKGL